MQGVASLGDTSDKIWAYFDSVPPKTLTRKFAPAQTDSFATTYGAVINNLNPQNQDDMQNLLKDKYVDWEKYTKNPDNLPNPLPTTDGGEVDYQKVRLDQFQRWALTAGLETSTIKAGTTLIKQTDVVSTAITKWTSANGDYAYTATQKGLTDALQKGQSKTVSMNSEKESSDTSHAWASGSVSGFYDFFSGSAGGSWDKFTQKISKAGLEIQVSFDKVATLTGGPYQNNAPTNPTLSQYKPWFDSAALQTAKENDNNKVWKHGAPTWEQTFGANGNLKRAATALIVVDGVDVTLTSDVSVSSQQSESVKAAAKAGFWPFFSVSGQGGWSHEVQKADDGGLKIHSTSKSGNPQVLGVLVQPIDAVIGNQ